MKSTSIPALFAILFGLAGIASGYAWSIDQGLTFLVLAIVALAIGLVCAVAAVSRARAQ